MWPNQQFSLDLVTSAEEIHNERLSTIQVLNQYERLHFSEFNLLHKTLKIVPALSNDDVTGNFFKNLAKWMTLVPEKFQKIPNEGSVNLIRCSLGWRGERNPK